MKSRTPSSFLVSINVAIAIAGTVRADTFTWLGTNTMRYSSAADWDPMTGPPDGDDTAIFPATPGGNVLISGTSNAAMDMEVVGGDYTLRPVDIGAGERVLTVGSQVIVRDGGTLRIQENESTRPMRLQANGQFELGTTGTGNAVVSTAGGILNVGQNLIVGRGAVGNPVAAGNLDILAGGTVNVTGGFSVFSIGERLNTTGDVDIDGAGSTLNAGSIRVGRIGDADLSITGGGVATGTSGSIAEEGGTSAVSVNGADSRLELTSLGVGGDEFNPGGNGTLRIENGGTAEISGNVSVWENGLLFVSDSNMSTGALTLNGPLFMLGQSTLTSTDSIVADDANADLRVSIADQNTSWENTGTLTVGNFGDAVLDIELGANVSNTTGSVGARGGSNSSVLLTNVGSRWMNSGDLFVGGRPAGNGGTGLVQINAGTTVETTGLTRLYTNGTVALNGGTLATGTIELAGGNIDWESGTLQITGAAGLSIGSGGPFGQEFDLVADQTLVVDNELAITADGNLNSFRGIIEAGQAAIASGGRLFVLEGIFGTTSGTDNAGELLLVDTTIDGPVHNAAGSATNIVGDVTYLGEVSGAGAFFGSGTAHFDGGFSPGDSPAVVPFEGSLAYGANNTLFVELGGLADGEFDRLEIEGDATLEGALAVALLDAFTPSPGDVFEFLNVAGTLSGEFDGLDEGSLVGNFGGANLFITYAAGDGNDVALFTPVPEPAAMLLVMIAATAVVGIRHQRGRPGITTQYTAFSTPCAWRRHRLTDSPLTPRSN
jgi:T5SS/PEP-CTERM-associated repeat protein